MADKIDEILWTFDSDDLSPDEQSASTVAARESTGSKAACELLATSSSIGPISLASSSGSGKKLDPSLSAPLPLQAVPVSATSPDLAANATLLSRPDVQVPNIPTVQANVQGAPVKSLVRGERFDLSAIVAQHPVIQFELIAMAGAIPVKLICLGLEASEILAGSAYCVGPRQPSSPCGGIIHQIEHDGRQSILIRVGSLPPTVKRVEVSVVSGDPASSLGRSVVGVRFLAGGAVVAESRSLDETCSDSTCATLVEVYEREGTWRMRIIGQVVARSVNELLAKHGAKV
jgi:stress response protein SCP2